jgi:hypothetical protein
MYVAQVNLAQLVPTVQETSHDTSVSSKVAYMIEYFA